VAIRIVAKRVKRLQGSDFDDYIADQTRPP